MDLGSIYKKKSDYSTYNFANIGIFVWYAQRTEINQLNFLYIFLGFTKWWCIIRSWVFEFVKTPIFYTQCGLQSVGQGKSVIPFDWPFNNTKNLQQLGAAVALPTHLPGMHPAAAQLYPGQLDKLMKWKIMAFGFIGFQLDQPAERAASVAPAE